MYINIALVYFILLKFFTCAQSACELSVVDTCTDDLTYLRCRFEEEIKVLENESGVINKNDPLFSDAGHQSCEKFCGMGFCKSNPEEMSSYCCHTYSNRESNKDNNAEVDKVASNDVILLDNDEAPLNNGATENGIATSVLPHIDPTSSSENTNKPLPTIITTPLISGTSSPQKNELCEFVDSVSEVGSKIRVALAEFMKISGFSQDLRRLSTVNKIPQRGHGRLLQGAIDGETDTQNQLVNTVIGEGSLNDESISSDPSTTSGATDQVDNELGLNIFTYLDQLLALANINSSNLDFLVIEKDIITNGHLIAQKLDKCNNCLLPIVETALDGALQTEEGRRREPLIQLTANELTPKLVKALLRFSEELNFEAPESSTDELEIHIFIEHLNAASSRVLKEDNLGGLMTKLVDVFEIINTNLEDKIKAEIIQSRSELIYKEVFHCNSTSTTTEYEPIALTRHLTTVEGLLGESQLLESWHERKSETPEVRTLQENYESQGSNINEENELNENGSTEDSNNLDDYLEGQACLDRPALFIKSLKEHYTRLTCEELIASVGCKPERFFLPMTSIIEGCKLTWITTCWPSSEVKTSVDDLKAAGVANASSEMSLCLVSDGPLVSIAPSVRPILFPTTSIDSMTSTRSGTVAVPPPSSISSALCLNDFAVAWSVISLFAVLS